MSEKEEHAKTEHREQHENHSSVSDKKKRRNLILVIIVVIVMLVGGLIIFNNSSSLSTNLGSESVTEKNDQVKNADSNVITYTCDEGKTVNAVYNNDEEFSSVDIEMSDGTSVMLQQVESASGTRYANADESIVFWSSGDEAFVEDHGEESFANCTSS